MFAFSHTISKIWVFCISINIRFAKKDMIIVNISEIIVLDMVFIPLISF